MTKFISDCYQSYSAFCDTLQQPLPSKTVEGLITGCSASFATSFIASRGNLRVGLMGATTALVAKVFETTISMALRKNSTSKMTSMGLALLSLAITTPFLRSRELSIVKTTALTSLFIALFYYKNQPATFGFVFA